MKLNNKQSILSYDFSLVKRDLDYWLIEREKKSKIYCSYKEYIQFLEEILKYEDDEYEKYLIQKKIKKLKKEQKKYYVPSILEGDLLKKSSSHCLKKIRSKNRK